MRTELTDYERGFLEGIFEGEGSIYVYKQKETPRTGGGTARRGWHIRITMSVCNNEIEILDKIQEILKTNKNYTKKYNNITDNINYELKYHHKELRLILPKLKFLGHKEIRRVKALEILEMIDVGLNQHTNTPEREEKYIKLIESWE